MKDMVKSQGLTQNSIWLLIRCPKVCQLKGMMAASACFQGKASETTRIPPMAQDPQIQKPLVFLHMFPCHVQRHLRGLWPLNVPVPPRAWRSLPLCASAAAAWERNIGSCKGGTLAGECHQTWRTYIIYGGIMFLIAYSLECSISSILSNDTPSVWRDGGGVFYRSNDWCIFLR